MASWLLVVVFFRTALIAAAAECAELRLCARLAKPRVVFFVGEAVAERHREGRQPEYRFQVLEPITGLPPGLPYVVIETGEGVPPSGALLIQAHLSDADGVLLRERCDFAASRLESIDELNALRRLLAVEPAVTVKISDAQGKPLEQTRLLAEGPISRWADRDGQLPPLPPGLYRLTASAPGYRISSRVAEFAAGACHEVEIRFIRRR